MLDSFKCVGIHLFVDLCGVVLLSFKRTAAYAQYWAELRRKSTWSAVVAHLRMGG